MHTVAVVALRRCHRVRPDHRRSRCSAGWCCRPVSRDIGCWCAEPSPSSRRGRCASRTDHGITELAGADTIVVPGRNDVTVAPPDDLVQALRSAFDAGTRIASICSGAFTLAAAGLLDGKRATTHWLAADLFRASFPAVSLDPDVLYVDEGQVLTSAGASAGLDLCLHMVARRLRRRRRRRCRTACRRTPAPQRGTGAVHPAKHRPRQAHCGADRTRRRAGMDRAGGAS